MKRTLQTDQRGVVDTWLLAFSGTLILLLGALGFGFWAYGGMQDYKNNVDTKIAVAVTEAEDATKVEKDAEFAQKEKNPLRIYTGPAAYGSVSVSYPKTWSVYMDESAKGTNPLNGFFNPGFVPGLTSGNNVALRVQVVNTAYDQVVRSMESAVKSSKIKVEPFTAKKVQGAVGLRGDGEVVNGKQGAMVIVPIRDKTLKIWTEASQYVDDFDKIILPNLNFIP